jgi:hypothetical protein
MSARKEQKQRARHQRLEFEAALRAQERRKRWRAGLAATAAGLVLLGGAVVAAQRGAHYTKPASPISRGELAPLTSIGELKPPGYQGALGPEGAPVPDAPQLAGDRTAAAGPSVDAIRCQGAEQVLFHIHARLTVVVHGQARQIPYGIGIPGAQAFATQAGPYVAAGSCFYWLHTHAAGGIIHIESPVPRTYTLGNFFDEWRQQLGRTAVGPIRGQVTAL